ncbi:MAG: exodeoxyribonuclease VII small subunit [Ignavibacteriales bacterium]|nr:MAG: exodeoxyribonuclease VII small subunit [Ignavibacteriales bacterium]
MTKKTTKDSFEKKLKRLEEISSLLESDSVGLEESIELFEEGMNLSRVCMKTLKEAELKITTLKNNLTELNFAEESEE